MDNNQSSTQNASVFLHIQTHIYIYIYMCLHVCHMHIHTYTHTYMYIYKYAHFHTYACMYTYICMPEYTYVYMCVYTYISTHIHSSGSGMYRQSRAGQFRSDLAEVQAPAQSGAALRCAAAAAEGRRTLRLYFRPKTI